MPLAKRFAVLLVVLVGALGLVVLGACSPAGQRKKGAREDVEAVMSAWPAKWTQKDVEGFLALWTDKGLQHHFGGTREQLRISLPPIMGRLPTVIREMDIPIIILAGGEAEIDYTLAEGKLLTRYRDFLDLEDGFWRITDTGSSESSTYKKGSRLLISVTPDGVTNIDVELDESAFVFDPSPITSGFIALRLKNVGKQAHEVRLYKAEEGASLDGWAQAATEDEAPGVLIGEVEPVDSGRRWNVLFDGDLDPGRYVIACYLPDLNDAADTTHAAKGMVSEFRVP